MSLCKRNRTPRAVVLGAVLLGASGVAGCGGAEGPKAREPASSPVEESARPPATTAEEAAAPAHPAKLRRARVREVLAEGPGAFLSRVELEEAPVTASGKFVGFRIAKLRGDPTFWEGVDLRPGDVVTRVNGFPIERPDDAFRAFQSLDVASELRVDYLRDGAPRALVHPIVDD